MPHYECKTQYSGGREELTGRIISRYSEKKGKSRHECRKDFIEILSTKDSFCRNYYTMKVDSLSQDINSLPDNLILGLGQSNLRFMDTKYVSFLDKKTLMDIPYMQIQKWGYSDVLFTLLFGKKDAVPSKIVLQTALVGSSYSRAPVFRIRLARMLTS